MYVVVSIRKDTKKTPHTQNKNLMAAVCPLMHDFDCCLLRPKRREIDVAKCKEIHFFKGILRKIQKNNVILQMDSQLLVKSMG